MQCRFGALLLKNIYLCNKNRIISYDIFPICRIIFKLII